MSLRPALTLDLCLNAEYLGVPNPEEGSQPEPGSQAAATAATAPETSQQLPQPVEPLTSHGAAITETGPPEESGMVP